jgi:hypothetical protein
MSFQNIFKVQIFFYLNWFSRYTVILYVETSFFSFIGALGGILYGMYKGSYNVSNILGK